MLVFIGLTITNFFWQLVTGHDWGEAFKLSFFQGAAIFAYWCARRWANGILNK